MKKFKTSKPVRLSHSFIKKAQKIHSDVIKESKTWNKEK